MKISNSNLYAFILAIFRNSSFIFVSNVTFIIETNEKVVEYSLNLMRDVTEICCVKTNNFEYLVDDYREIQQNFKTYEVLLVFIEKESL